MKYPTRLYGRLTGLLVWGAAAVALAGTGTESDPYTIAEALALSAGTTEYWAQGYVVGGRYDNFDSPWTADYGLSCADTDNETDVNNCLQVKLESDGGRTTWGLASNPGNFQKQIKFRGKRDSYGGYPSFEGINNADISEVSASNQSPEFDVNPGPISATVNVAVAFSVSATGSPAPDLALADTTASDGYSFTAGTGELNYTPPANDLGAQSFTFTASNSLGVATQVVSVSVSNALVSAPVFDVIGPQSALVETPINFTVSATGYPAPVLALDTATASDGYSFTVGTGELSYTPPTNDLGAQTFTFTASNSAGVATQMVDVVVSLVPVILEPPASVWASDTHSTDFTAAWSASAGATGYRLDVSTSATFSGGGMGAGSRTNDCVASGGSSYDTRMWTDGNHVDWTAYKARTDETVNGNPSICLQNATGAYLVSEGIPNGIGGLSFDVQQKYSGSGGELTVYVNGSQVGTFAYGETVQTATFVNIDVETVASLVVSNNGAVRLAINNLVWSDYGASAASYVPGYSNRTVAVTSQSVTGLTENTEYFFRVRAVNGGETSSNSATASVTTLPPTDVPPTLDPVSPITVNTGETATVWITARETDGDTMTLFADNLPINASFTTVNGTGVISNLFSFTPATSQTGQTYVVTFYAGDIHGTNSVTLNLTVASADPWADYYATCYSNGVLKTGDDLKNALHDIIDNHTTYSYNAAVNIIKEIDECPTNSSMVQLLYLQHGRAKENFGGGAGQWNREHVWAKSHGFPDEGATPCYSDVHHLHPTDVSVNNMRGNLDFDTVDGTSNSYSYDSSAFEPPDAAKGDAARAMFYMAVRYNGEGDTASTENLELTNIIPTSLYTPWFGKLATLLDWNELDEVNAYEIRRNDLVYSNYQGNRNPFVDHPEWARIVFDPTYVAPHTLTASAGAGGSISPASASVTNTGSQTFTITADSGYYISEIRRDGVLVTPTNAYAGLSSYDYLWSTVTNDGTLSATFVLAVPPLPAPASAWADPTNTHGFSANWSSVGEATGYQLDIRGPNTSAVPGTVMALTEAFDSVTGNGSTAVDTQLFPGWTFDNVFASTNELRVGSSRQGVVTTPVLDMGTTVTVSFAVTRYGTDTPTVVVGLTNAGAYVEQTVDVPVGGTNGTLVFTVGASGSQVIWKGNGASNQRFYLDDIVVSYWGVASGSAPVSLTGYPTNVGLITSSGVSNLTPSTEYEIHVAAMDTTRTSTWTSAVVTTRDVVKSNQSIAFSIVTNQITTNTLTLTATADSGLPVSLAVVSGPGAVTEGSTLTFSGAGNVAVVASQAGNTQYNPAPEVTNIFTVSKAPAILTLNDLLQEYSGSNCIATVTVDPPSLAGDVIVTYSNYFDGSAAVPLDAGFYEVRATVNTAMYQGDTNDTLTVQMAEATVTLGNLVQTADGSPKSATATTIPAGLTVDFTYDGAAIAPSNAGRYAVTGTVNDVNYTGFAVGTLVLDAALSPFEQWLQDQGKNHEDANYAKTADVDNDGMTTWEEYLADTDPDDASRVLVLVGTYSNALQSGTDTGQMHITFPVSTSRYYQFVYSTNLASPTLTNYLGRGRRGMAVTNHAPAVWYGTIRVLLDEPE